MRRFLSIFVLVSGIGCSDASDIDGPSYKNLLFRVDVTGDPTLAPPSFGLMLDGLFWQSTRVASDEKLSVPTGNHTLRLAPFENTSVTWCSQAEPSTIKALFTRRDVVSGHFVVYCPPATGTGILQTTLEVHGSPQNAPYTFRLTRTIGIPGTLTYTVTPGKVHEQELTAGIYRVELGKGCGLLEPTLAVAIRRGQTATLPVTFTCVFTFPPGIP